MPPKSFFLPLLGALAVAAGCAAPPATTGVSSSPAPPAPAAEASVWALPAGLPAPAPVSRAEYAARRAALAARMEDGVLIAFGAFTPEFDYLETRQGADFRYLTGVLETGTALVVAKRGGVVDELLFVRRRDPSREVWEGRMLGTDGAQRLTGIRSLTNDRIVPVLDSLLATHGRLYTLANLPGAEAIARGVPLARDEQILLGVLGRRPGVEAVPLLEEVRRLRAAKSPVELDLIRRAVHISVAAHRAAMRTLQPDMNEFEIQALIEYMFRRNGAERPAYASIVGSGPNSTTLHYNDNDRVARAGEVLLIDAGASYRGYAADVTRTMPVSGRFSPEQREIYAIVLEAQKAAERLARPGATMAELSAAAERVLADGLARLGLIESADATYRCESARFGAVCPQLRLFYMHGLGHGVGLHVHDPDVYQYGEFQPGSAFTIEPGIYVRADVFDFLPDTPENRAMVQRLRPVVGRYVDIGVRIEDVYIIGATGAERVSAGVPREIAEVEALMRAPAVAADGRRPDVVDWYRATEP
jgi:Xaa-Pro aminopeptidase